MGGAEGMSGGGRVGADGASGMTFPRSDLRRGRVAAGAGVGGRMVRATGTVISGAEVSVD